MARRFYEKGCHFIAAAILLRQKGGDEYVVIPANIAERFYFFSLL
jgi:hypothetical protein